ETCFALEGVHQLILTQRRRKCRLTGKPGSPLTQFRRSLRTKSCCKVHLSSSDDSDNQGAESGAACSPLTNTHPLWVTH
ncbi:mCG1028254, partial [Mus musculus]